MENVLEIADDVKIAPIDSDDSLSVDDTFYDAEATDIADVVAVPLENDLFDAKELQKAENDTLSDTVESTPEEVIGYEVLSKEHEHEFTCTQCFLIRDKSLLADTSDEKNPVCVFCA